MERYDIQQPVFYGGCARDYICIPAMAQKALQEHVKDLTSNIFNADHWVMLSHAEEVNEALLKWVEEKA